ncbi:MAG: exodeoxyribonuclease VII small subunit [bacterium]
MAKKDKAASFEESIEKLQELVESIESGGLGLEETIAKYEEGGKIIKACREILDKAELKISKLVENTDRQEPFTPDE